jgi:ABC-type lipoprotein release transport system permease subunit
MLVRIAWRNVWRNKIRSLVIVAAVALGLWGGIFSDAFMQGMAKQQVYSSIHTETGHIQINRPDFLVNHDMQLIIPDADSIANTIATKPGVAAVSPVLQLTSMASTASGSAGIMINGINPKIQEHVSDLYKLVTEGNYFKEDRSNQAVIGKQLADKLKLKTGSRLVVTLQTSTGDITYGAFTIAGIYHTSNTEFDKYMVFVNKKDLQNVTGLNPGTASIITVLLQNTDNTEAVSTAMQKKFPNMQVQQWMQLSPVLEIMSSTMQQTTYIFVGIILIALAFGIVNTMLMAVLDRTREIGMLLSIGMKPAKVFGMIMLETIFLSVTGAVAGVAASIITISVFGHKGINLSIIGSGINALGYSSMVYPALGADFYIVLAVMVIMIAIVAGIFPARRAIRLKPAEAMRGD